MTKIVGTLNAIFRIACGFTILAWSTAYMVRRPYHRGFQWFAFLGGMKIAEGITRFCPLTALGHYFYDNRRDDHDQNELFSEAKAALYTDE
ncbi:DUF2892 domain-containing protein [Bacillaceae bacterium SIJ1]|uniref:YgaP family membrane protein n=1 Tax=Litoribacterium kuwaitense TaxID=1398745 RepID=UPI0013EA43FD|nr:DUF2892 domain-containing protein [Litoribacterium kuwaitense]NGP46077.1 DUF2892 domain-containing protein [Litoribacterium kuwaitense]